MFRYISLISELLPVVFYLVFFQRNKHEGLQVIFIICLFSFASDLVGIAMQHLNINLFFFYALFNVVEYSLCALFFYLSTQNKKLKFVPVIGSLLFYALAITIFFIGKSSEFDSLSASMEAILIIVYCILFLYQQMRDPSILFVYQSKKFWVVVAIFIYFSSTLFLFISESSLTNKEISKYWYINNIFDIIKNILFCIAFSMKKNKTLVNPVDTFYTDI